MNSNQHSNGHNPNHQPPPPPPPPYQQQQYQNYQYPPPPPPPYNLAPMPKTNNKAIVALVLGILSIMIPYIGFFIGIVAIIYASLSMKEIKRTNDQGKGLAVAGLVTGIIGTVLYGIILLIVVIVMIVAFNDSSMYY
ncbi:MULTISPECIES: DUF4190 domain-containing protein [unclassified Paenibacillus]|uniref:DUF4190 domain-containing protein n=1 Tax=unclassified Paenibacillus TaxID=185978 RepID=UPI002F41B155